MTRAIHRFIRFDWMALTLLVTFSGAADAAAGQQTEAGPNRVETKVSAEVETDDQYRIGPGDTLEIRIYNRPQLSGTLRVTMAGTIQMPLIEGDIQAACRTETQLAEEIATLYLREYRHPYVNVLVKEYASTPVAVIGAVDKPGRFQLTRRIRLLELLAYAGGPTDKAGPEVIVARTGGLARCAETGKQQADVAKDFESYDLKQTLRGEPKASPFIEPGDIVSITEVDQAYVVGNVFKPQPVSLKGHITVSQAIAMAGGVLPASKADRIRVFRKMPGSGEQTLIVVNLTAIKDRKADDFPLEANDIVEVPTSSSKKILGNILGAIAPTVSTLPYVIGRR